jgi:hypothetical protein
VPPPAGDVEGHLVGVEPAERGGDVLRDFRGRQHLPLEAFGPHAVKVVAGVHPVPQRLRAGERIATAPAHDRDRGVVDRRHAGRVRFPGLGQRAVDLGIADLGGGGEAGAHHVAPADPDGDEVADVSGATPDWPSALMNCCALMLAWLAKAVTPSSISSGVAATPKRRPACHLQAFVDQRLAGLGHHLAGRVQERQEALALLDLVIRDDVVVHAHGDGEGALRPGLGRGGRGSPRSSVPRRGQAAGRRGGRRGMVWVVSWRPYRVLSRPAQESGGRIGNAPTLSGPARHARQFRQPRARLRPSRVAPKPFSATVRPNSVAGSSVAVVV